jgi:hypothetical protein
MLFLDTSFEVEGVTLFRDYNSRNRFYYMPRAPHMTVKDGQPLFQLLIYRRDITDNPDFKEGDRPGGGFLTMSVDIGVPKGLLDEIKGQLSGSAGEVELVPVPFENGSVRVSALGFSTAGAASGTGATGPHFVENILGSVTPSLYGNNAAVFSIELSHEGVLLMRSSLSDPGATQVAVVYDLDYRGLLPAYQAKITIEFKQAYEYLHTRMALNTLLLKADVDAEMEVLRKEGHIKIDSTDYQESDPAKLAEHATKLEALAKELATWAFFKPGLQPGKVLAEDRGTLPPLAPPPDGSLQNQVTAPLLAAGTGRGSPGDVAGPRLPATSALSNTNRVGGANAPAAGSGGTTAPAAGGETAVDAWNKAGRPQASFLMRSLSQSEQQTITYNLNQVGATKRTAAPQGAIAQLPGASAMPGRIKEIDLNDPFFERIRGTVTSTADLASAGVTSMVVKLQYGVRDDGSKPKDTKEVVITKTGDSEPFDFFMDRRKSITLEYQVVVNWKAGFALGAAETQSVSPWISTTTRNLDIDPQAVSAVFPVTLILGAVDFNVVTQVQSVVGYADAASNTQGERTVLLSQANPQVVVPIRPRDSLKRAFTVRTSFFYGAVEEVVEQQGNGQSLIVLNPPTTRAVPVSVTAVDPLAHYSKILVELSYGPEGGAEQAKTIELGGAGTTGSWTFLRPADTAPSFYRYRVTRFGKDGTTNIDDWQQTRERALIVGDRFDRIFDVEVRFLVPDFAAAGFQGATLILDYPEALPGLDPHEEKFFTGTPTTFVWRVPQARTASRRYTYSVEWIRKDGTVRTVGPITTQFEVLRILPPTGD